MQKDLLVPYSTLSGPRVVVVVMSCKPAGLGLIRVWGCVWTYHISVGWVIAWRISRGDDVQEKNVPLIA